MATNFPGSLDTSTQQPSPSSTTDLDASGYEHDVVHTNHSGAIIALETKLGTGDSNAVEGAVLMGTGSGTSAWDTTPTIKGQVEINSAAENAVLKLTSTDEYALVSFADDGATAHGYAAIGGQDNGLAFFAGGNQRVTVLSDGKVGIGDTTPLHTLEIHSDDDLTSFTGTGLGVMKLVNNQYDSGDFTSLDFGYSGNNYALGRIATKITGSGSSMHFGTSNTYASGITNTAMTIDSSGNVGIGTTTPMRELDVWSEVLIHHGDDAWLWQNAGSSQFRLWFQDSYTSGDSGWSQKIQVDSSGSTDLQILGGYDTGYTQGSVMITSYDVNRGSGVYMFNAGEDKTWYAGMPYTSTDRYILGRVDATSLSTSAASASGALFEFRSNGAAYNTTGTWGNSSDVRMKGDIETARSYLADLNQLRIVTYKLTKDPQLNEDMELEFVDRESPSEKMLGLIAQEVESVFPAMVTDGTKEAMAIKQSVLIPMLITAVQELTTRVAALEG